MREMIYIGDAMCSWCWGFAPVITELKDKYADELQFSLVLGGLRPGDLAEKSDEKTKKYLKHHWRQVAKATGQPFKYEFFDWQDFLYDTEPAAKAIKTLQGLRPESDFAYFKDLQHAFYAENEDITSFAILAKHAAKFEVDAKAFEINFHSENLRKAIYEEFFFVSKLGVQGFPAVLFKENERYMYLTKGYQPIEQLEKYVQMFVNEGLPEPAAPPQGSS